MTTLKNTVIVNGETSVVTVKTAGPQGPSLPDGDKGDVTVSSNGTAIAINTGAVTSAKILDGTIVDADINASAAIQGTKINPNFGSQDITTTGNIDLPDTSTVKLGTDDDFILSYDNPNDEALIAMATGKRLKLKCDSLHINNAGDDSNILLANDTGSVSLFFGTGKKFETTSAGATITGNISVTGTVDGRDVATDGTKLDGIEANAINASNTAITNKLLLAGGTITGNLTVEGDFTVNGTTTTIDTTTLTVEDKNIELGKVSTPTDTTADGGGITLKGATDKTFQWVDATDSWTSSEHISLPDNKKLKLGASQDIEIFHNGSNSFFVNNTGYLQAKVTNGSIFYDAENHVFRKADASENMAKFLQDGAVELYFDGSKKFDTTSTGVTVTGNITAGAFLSSNASGQAGLNFGDGVQIHLGASNDLQIYHDGSNSYLQNITGNLIFKNNSADYIRLKIADASTEVVGNLDVGGIIHTTGNQIKIEGVAPVLTFTETNDNPDYQISGNGGSLTFKDTTNAIEMFKISSNGNIQIPNDSIRLQFGASQDLDIFHHGGNSLITNKTGTLLIHSDNLDLRPNTNSGEVYLRCTQDSSVELRFDSVKKFETTSSGATITGDLTLNESNPAIFFNDTGDNPDYEVGNHDGVFAIQDNTNNVNRFVINTDGNVQIPVDNGKLQLGAGQDLQLFHTGTYSNIYNATGDLDISSDVTRLKNGNRTENFAAFINNGQAELYYDNVKRFETTSAGAKVIGELNVQAAGHTNFRVLSGDSSVIGFMQAVQGSDLRFGTSTNSAVNFAQNGLFRLTLDTSGNVNIPDDTGKFQLGASQDLELYHNGSNSVIKNSTNTLFIASDTISLTNAAINETYVNGVSNGAVKLFFDDAKKAETTANGFQVSNGNLDIFNTSGGANIRNISSSGSFFIGNPNNGDLALYVQDSTDNNIVLQVNTGEKMLECTAGGSTDLYFHGTKKLETTSTGVSVTGNITVGALLSSNSSGQAGLAFGDNVQIHLGTGNDLQLYHDGTDSYIKNTTNDLIIESTGDDVFVKAADNMFFHVQGTETGINIAGNGSTDLFFDNSKKLETTSTGIKVLSPSANPDIKITGALGSGAEHRIFVAGSNSESLQITGNTRLFLNANDINFRDASTTVDLFTITSNGDVNLPRDSKKLQIGASQDLFLEHDGNNSVFRNATGDLYIQDNSAGNIYIQPVNNEGSINAFANDRVELAFDGSTKLQTTSTGVSITGNLAFDDNEKAIFGTGSDFEIFHDGNHTNLFEKGTGNLALMTNGGELQLAHNDNAGTYEHMVKCITNGAVELYHNGGKKLETTNLGIEITGTTNSKLSAANGTLILESTNNDVFAQASDDFIVTVQSGEAAINAIGDGAVQLFYNGVKKLETTSWGTQISGTLKTQNGGLSIITDSEKFTAGAGDDLQIFHDGGTSFISNITGDLRLTSDNNLILRSADQTENYLVATRNSDVELFFDGSLKLQTSSSGITVTGSVTTQDMNMSNLNGSANEVDNTKGSWSIQEGSNDLFIINRVTGKKYKFNLTEIS